MASICLKVIILFLLACLSTTLSYANEGWFRASNCTSPSKPRHRHPQPPPPPPSRRPRTPPLPSPPLKQPRTPPSPTPQSPRKIIVGDSKNWRLGFNYSYWTVKKGPFYQNDILVFKYDPPKSSTPPHSVYLLPNMQSFVKCDFRRAKMIANLTQGRGNGFKFVLKHKNPYYFACGEGNGFHCNSGSMKFSITPQSRLLPRPRTPPRHLPSPPPPSQRPRTPPRHLPSPPPPSQRPRTPPRHLPSPPPPSQRPRTPPRHLSSPPPPSQRPRTPPPPRHLPSPPPRTPPTSPSPTPQSPRKIIVGGSKNWGFGFNYSDWTVTKGPFYQNDILVFKYDPPNSSTPPHSVYLLPNMQSFVKCDFGRAKLIANLTQGKGSGFMFVLKQKNPYYFACGEGNGFHCNSGSMKFSISPQSKRLPPPPPPPPSRQPRTPPPYPVAPPPPPPSPSEPPQTPPSSPPPPQQVPALSPPPSSPPPPSRTPHNPRKIIVGGSENWHIGFNYNDWALKNGPFYVNDILVFKYDGPNSSSSSPAHSVYVLPNMESYTNCDIGKGKMVANLTQGSGDGFEFVLINNNQNPYYFACGEGSGFHCKLGSMKFSVTPILILLQPSSSYN